MKHLVNATDLKKRGKDKSNHRWLRWSKEHSSHNSARVGNKKTIPWPTHLIPVSPVTGLSGILGGWLMVSVWWEGRGWRKERGRNETLKG